MNRTRRMIGCAGVATLCLVLGSWRGAPTMAQSAATRDQDPGGGKQPYTMPEYNAYKACDAETNPATKVKCLDDFVARYPNSALLVYIYPLYYRTFNQLKNYPKVMEYADKLVALNDKAEPLVRYEALYARAFAYTTLNSSDQDQATKARQAALDGLKAVGDLKKPDNVSEEEFKKQKQQPTILFNYTAANAAVTLKDYAAAVESFKAVLALDPGDPVTWYRLGQAYQVMTPPQQMEAFWAFSKAVTAKRASEGQSKQVKTYLRKLLVNYQQAGCENLVDAELNELLQLAGSSADRPATYTLPGSADLDAARKDMTIASVITDLKAGGDKGKVTWLASCGLEFPEVPGKVIEITPGTDIVLKIAFVTSDAEFEAATTPNMEVKVAGQPEAARVEKDSAIHFTGTLESYDPDPSFMLHWDKAKVKAEDIPKEKAAPKKPTRRPAPRKPSGH